MSLRGLREEGVRPAQPTGRSVEEGCQFNLRAIFSNGRTAFERVIRLVVSLLTDQMVRSRVVLTPFSNVIT